MDADLDSKEAEERSTHDDRLMLLPERGRTTHAPRIHNRGLGGLTIREAKKKKIDNYSSHERQMLPERGRITHAPRIHNRGLGGLTITEAHERSTTTPCMMTD